MSKKKKGEQLAIYDPEGLDPQTDVTYREVKVSLQDNITATRTAIHRSWTTLKVESRRVFGDTRKSLTDVVGKARKQTNATLSSLGVGTSGQVLRGTAVTSGALVGLYLARKKSVFRLVLYPALGAGLVGGVIYRERLQAEYRKMERSYRSSAESWRKEDSRKQK